MANRVNLNDLVLRVFGQKPELEALRPVVVKELIHYEIMWALDNAGLLNDLTFHGGTALRLCHGASRLSEDLDFAGGPGFTRTDVDGISDVVQSHLTDRYGLEVAVKEPKPRKDADQPVEVDTWQISVVINPGQLHLPRQRIKIEFSTMEARTKNVQAIQQNYPVLPDGLGDLLVPAMSKEEIMSNKLVSLPTSVHQRNIRHRDIWDIAWLVRIGAEVNQEWVAARAAEFKLDDYVKRLDTMRDGLQDHVIGEKFREEIMRFLPRNTIAKTLDRPEFIDYMVTTVDEQLAKAREAFFSPTNTMRNDDDFRM